MGKKLPKYIKFKKKICQEWDSNPCPFGPVPETGALDQLGHLDFIDNNFNTILMSHIWLFNFRYNTYLLFCV